MMRIGLLCVLLLVSCRTVVTTTTEIRPTRYAAIELVRQLPEDSMISLAERALQAENLKIESTDRAHGQISAGPIHFDAVQGEPMLDASVRIMLQPQENDTRVQIVATSAVAAKEMGGHDSRLAALVKRIERRLISLIDR